jgi:hypothetical protein
MKKQGIKRKVLQLSQAELSVSREISYNAGLLCMYIRFNAMIISNFIFFPATAPTTL